MSKLFTTYQPLYRQVYEHFKMLLVQREWKPAELIPSEHELAAQLGVSQGTVRKALNQMVSENILKRRQGKGTYVAEHTQENSLLRFFRFREPNGKNLIPDTEYLTSQRRLSTTIENMHFGFATSEMVVEMTRVRSLLENPIILEKIIQPLSIFPDIDKQTTIPNFLYSFYQEKYGISIVKVNEELRATTLPEEYSNHLTTLAGKPVLLVERESVNLEGIVVEWSQAYCCTDNFVYSVSLN